jgi:hypothetical protein
MEQLTKEHFDEALAKLASNKALAQLEKNLTDQNAELARMVKKGFDGTDEKLAEIAEKLDVRGELDHLKLEFQEMKGKLEQALHVKL